MACQYKPNRKVELAEEVTEPAEWQDGKLIKNKRGINSTERMRRTREMMTKEKALRKEAAEEEEEEIMEQEVVREENVVEEE